MKRLVAISCLFVLCGCASMHSPYDLRDWCLIIGELAASGYRPNSSESGDL